MIEQRCAVFGEPYSFGACSAPFQQGQFELTLQLPHGLGHRGLADEQRFRSPGKAPLFGNGEKDAQQVQIDLHNSYSCSCEIYVFDSW